MKLSKSKNLKIFKNEIGQANHFLITILVGLDGVHDNKINIKEEFSTSWNPKNRIDSANRSREFAKKSALTWVVDNFDMYLRMCNEEPKLITKASIQSEFDGNGRSVYNNFNTIINYLEITGVDKALVDLLICWRNRLVHYKANNDISDDSKKILSDSKEMIVKNYNGLDIIRLLNNFDSGNVPTFKEIASMIRATINLVYKIESKLIENIDYKYYIDKVLYKYVKQNQKKMLNNIFSKCESEKKRIVINILKNSGFIEGENEVVDNFITDFISLNYSLAKNKYENGSFI